MSGEKQVWDVVKLDIKPGNILILRWNRPSSPTTPVSSKPSVQEVELVLNQAKKTARKALDIVGLTYDKVPVLVTTDEWDFILLNPLDLLDICATAERAKENNGQG